MNKAVFLDRDGTINIDFDHVFQVERIKLIDGVSNAVGLLRKNGFKIFIISNQSCIGRGYAKEEEVIACMDRVSQLMNSENQDALIDEAYFAPDHPESPSNRRKPEPGMLLEAIEKHKLNVSECWMVGDKLSDPLAGLKAGLNPNKCVLLEPDGIEGKMARENIQKAKELGFLFYKDLKELTNKILD